MAGKPIHVDLVGTLTGRERLWAAARKLREFTLMEWQDATKPVVRFQTCQTYLRCLIAGKYLAPVAPPTRNKSGFGIQETRYRVVKDCLDAPRLTRDGKVVTQGLAQLAMWRAMQVLKSFDWHDVKRAATVRPPRGSTLPAFEISDHTAKYYVNSLQRAGYFRTLQAAAPGVAARYALLLNTGARAPLITRRDVVFDRNKGEFQWQQLAQEVVDASE